MSITSSSSLSVVFCLSPKLPTGSITVLVDLQVARRVTNPGTARLLEEGWCIVTIIFLRRVVVPLFEAAAMDVIAALDDLPVIAFLCGPGIGR